MFGIATVKETVEFHNRRLPFSGIPLPFSTRQWEYPWCYSRFLDFGVGPGSRVLDVGCACNIFMRGLADLHFHVTGLDLYDNNDPRNLNPSFGGFNRAFENEYLTFCEADMSRIPLPENSFDAVYCLSVLEHCDESMRIAGINEMLRVLKPGKPLIITEDYIPTGIKPLPGILERCGRAMDYNFREHIASSGRLLAAPGVIIHSDEEIEGMRDRGELLLNCMVAPNEYYHFTAIGWVVLK